MKNTFFYNNDQSSSNSEFSQHLIHSKQLIKITDLLGRDINQNTKQSTLFYIYDDGSIEKKYILK